MTAEMSKEIRKALIDKGLTQPMLARELGITRQAVNMTINGKRSSKRTLAAIYQLLGLDGNKAEI